MVVITTTEPHVTLQQPVVVTSSKVSASPQVLRVTPGRQGKKPVRKGKGKKPLNKGKKNAVKASTSRVVSSTCPSTNLISKIQNKAKVTAVLIQELMEELQAIEQESLNYGPDSEATQESDLEQEDSENCLTDEEEQCLLRIQDLSSLFLEQYEYDNHPGKINITSYQLKDSDESNMNHTEEVIIGSEQGTTFPTRVGTTMSNSLIDTGATRSCISEKYYKKLQLTKIQFLQNINVRSATGSNLIPIGLVNYNFG